MKKQILIVATVSRHIEAFHLPYAEELRKRGWAVCAAAEGVEKSPAVKAAFDEVFEVPFSRSPLDISNARAWKIMRRLIRSRRFDLVHVHTPVAALVTRLAIGPMRKDLGFKILYTAHGFHFHPKGNPVSNWVFAALEKAGGFFTDVLFVMNRYDLDMAKKMNLAPRIEFVNGVGVDLSFFDPPAVSMERVRDVLNELKINDGVPYFVNVAEFNPGKRHMDMVQALKGVDGKCRVVLVGDGRLRDQVAQRVAELGLWDRFRFAGHRSREDVRALLQGSLGMVFPSSREGLPRAVIEAMAMGKLVIGADARGTVDLLEDRRG